MIEAYGRLLGLVHTSATDLSDEQAAHRPEPEANPIAWLVRVIDAQIADLAGTGQAAYIRGLIKAR